MQKFYIQPMQPVCIFTKNDPVAWKYVLLSMFGKPDNFKTDWEKFEEICYHLYLSDKENSKLFKVKTDDIHTFSTENWIDILHLMKHIHPEQCRKIASTKQFKLYKNLIENCFVDTSQHKLLFENDTKDQMVIDTLACLSVILTLNIPVKDNDSQIDQWALFWPEDTRSEMNLKDLYDLSKRTDSCNSISNDIIYHMMVSP